MDESAEDLEALRAKYCPPLEESLFLSIVQEWDALSNDERKQCLTTLEYVKQNAIIEQKDTKFDPAGTGGGDPRVEDGTRSQTRSSPEESGHSNGVTSITTGFSDLRWGDVTDEDRDFEGLSLDKKQQRLADMFPKVKPSMIREVLNRSGVDFNHIFDELLNLAFIREDSQGSGTVALSVPKGIEAFAADDTAERRRKGRGKRKNRTTDSSRETSTTPFSVSGTGTPKSVWTAMEEDLGFLCNTANMSYDDAKLAYLGAGRSLGGTIKVLALEKSRDYSGLENLHPLTQSGVIDLKHDFPTIPEKQLYGLLELAQIPPPAHELAEALLQAEEREVYGKRSDLVHYAPVKLAQDGPDAVNPSSPAWKTVDHSSLRTTAAAKSLAASQFFSQASSAARCAKSDHLMGAAAVYYSMEGHKRAQAAREHRAAAADAYVTSRATANGIDLHGTTVADAVRIAKAKTHAWWDGLGEARSLPRGGGPVQTGFHINTGVGRHSKDGVPKIGPAVGRALMNEGWKVEIGQGEISVYGKVKR